ncbi:MAG: hypothetical protein D6737_19110 [Chloroflexi bacterium]|nr:MAG: hypothetical protein CUN54_06820 [Phototrophicales bacterium]RMF76949.1 MAG: hypothetical protein D6737_19110 [Chloroflexota bacterium]
MAGQILSRLWRQIKNFFLWFNVDHSARKVLFWHNHRDEELFDEFLALAHSEVQAIKGDFDFWGRHHTLQATERLAAQYELTEYLRQTMMLSRKEYWSHETGLQHGLSLPLQELFGMTEPHIQILAHRLDTWMDDYFFEGDYRVLAKRELINHIRFSLNFEGGGSTRVPVVFADWD